MGCRMNEERLGVTTTEILFNEFFAELGAERIDASLLKGDKRENADYLFRSQNLVAELKVLESERAPSKKFYECAETNNWPASVLLDHPDNDRRKELLASYRPPMNAVCQKANRQLRQSKAMLGCGPTHGVLLIVNNRFWSLTPAGIIELLFDIVRTSCDEIDAIVYASYKLAIPVFGHGPKLWAARAKPHATSELVAMIDDMGLKWREFISRTNSIIETKTFATFAAFADWQNTEVVYKYRDRFVRVLSRDV